jgi:hypothetical protein
LKVLYNIFGIWLGSDSEWKIVQHSLPFGSLTWTTSALSKEVSFLDLNISIDASFINRKTFTKVCNLFLYIPPHSAHPPGVLRSLIFGNLRRFFLQCSNTSDYISAAKAFYCQHLIVHGHATTNIDPIFMTAATRLDNPNAKPDATNASTSRNLYLVHCWKYHPQGVKRERIRQLFHEHFPDNAGFDRLIVAHHRPRNLKEALVRTQLDNTTAFKPSTILPPMAHPIGELSI